MQQGDKMKELLILSGKGGTGKTSVAGAIAALADDKVLADCDVDAADLHLLLAPEIREEHEFVSGVKARVESSICTGCGTCAEICRFDAVSVDEISAIDPMRCEGCGVCAWFCPEKAIVLEDNRCGRWFLSDTEYGPLVHARLDIGEENSGKLVALVKREARNIAERLDKNLIVVDGPPGIGCPVIASMSGANLVLAVTEPTASGLHDLERVADLAAHFKVPACVCINKWDLNSSMAEKIKDACSSRNIELAGMIPFDEQMVESVVQGVPAVKAGNSPAVNALEQMWEKVRELM